MEVIDLADLLGTFAFCITGIIGSVKHQVNIFGAFFLAFATAMGGGIIRDMVLGVPSSTFSNPSHLSTVFFGVVFTYLFIQKIQDKYNFFVYLDAFGLAVFTVIGVKKAILLNLHFLGAIFSGTLTAVGGGIIRDTLIGEIPFIFQKEIYAASSLLGGIIFYCVYQLDLLPTSYNIVLSVTVIVTTRVWGYRNNIHLPSFFQSLSVNHTQSGSNKLKTKSECQMPKKAYLADHLSREDLKNRYRVCKDPVEARRWHFLWKMALGWTIKNAAIAVGLNSQYAFKILKKYNELGEEGVKNLKK